MMMIKAVLLSILILSPIVRSEISHSDVYKITASFFGAKNIHALNFISCFSTSKLLIFKFFINQYNQL